uniref:Uncharacterized protein n=1 Tax=Chelonoidis abingdonii TaxID=106734 RepID=A0A8C0J9R4_CHEAB
MPIPLWTGSLGAVKRPSMIAGCPSDLPALLAEVQMVSRAEGLEVNLLVTGAAPEAEVKALVVPVLHGIHYLLGHAHSEGEVTAHLPHHNGGSDVLGLDLNVLARHLLGDLQAAGAMLVATVLGAVGEGGWELVHLRLVHFLVHALLEALEDDSEL